MLALVLMIIPLGIEYMRQSSLKQQWLGAESRMLLEQSTAEAERLDLEARQTYVQTDAYIERAARSRLRMTRPGEVLVVLVGTPRASTRLPVPVLAPSPTSVPEPWWRRILDR